MSDLLVGEGIRFRDDGDEVDLGVEPAHELDIDLLQTESLRQRPVLWS